MNEAKTDLDFRVKLQRDVSPEALPLIGWTLVQPDLFVSR